MSKLHGVLCFPKEAKAQRLTKSHSWNSLILLQQQQRRHCDIRRPKQQQDQVAITARHSI